MKSILKIKLVWLSLLIIAVLCLIQTVFAITGSLQETHAKGSRPKVFGKRHATSELPAICIDPGHPSETNSGTTVQNGLREVEVVYDVAMELKKIIEARGIARVVMTRDFRSADGKRMVTNRRRAEIANEANAVLLLRLHCDTGNNSGFTLYYPDREGKKFGHTGPSPEVREKSSRAAKLILAGMAHDLAGSLRNNGIRGDSATAVGSKQGSLTGSIFRKGPTVTVEMVFLSNPADAKFIGSLAGRRRMAGALATGVAVYIHHMNKGKNAAGN
jgi:N-acetylmuramoyl-L-alanine amidase